MDYYIQYGDRLEFLLFWAAYLWFGYLPALFAQRKGWFDKLRRQGKIVHHWNWYVCMFCWPFVFIYLGGRFFGVYLWKKSK